MIAMVIRLMGVNLRSNAVLVVNRIVLANNAATAVAPAATLAAPAPPIKPATRPPGNVLRGRLTVRAIVLAIRRVAI